VSINIYEAERLKHVSFSGIRKVVDAVTDLEGKGETIIHMELGRPDFDTPEHIKKATKKALDDGLVHYCSNYGLPELRKAIAFKLIQENNIPVTPEEIIVTSGATEAIFLSMFAVLDPGDEILIPEPAFGVFHQCAYLAGAKPISVPLKAENGFKIQVEELEKQITSKTKMIVVNTPNNPTGIVYDEELLRQITEFAQRHDLLVISDEIYEKTIFDNNKHISLASFPNMKERTFTVNGFTKSYAMDGWRLGYLAADHKFVSSLIRAHQYINVSICTFAQKGAVTAIESSQDCVEDMVKEYSDRKNLVVNKLKEMGLPTVEPKGTFFAFPDITSLGMSSEQASNYFLKDAKVATVPGNCFGKAGEGLIRLSFSCSYSDLETGLKNMKRSVYKLKKPH
jgi:aminotransferase